MNKRFSVQFLDKFQKQKSQRFFTSVFQKASKCWVLKDRIFELKFFSLSNGMLVGSFENRNFLHCSSKDLASCFISHLLLDNTQARLSVIWIIFTIICLLNSSESNAIFTLLTFFYWLPLVWLRCLRPLHPVSLCGPLRPVFQFPLQLISGYGLGRVFFIVALSPYIFHTGHYSGNV